MHCHTDTDLAITPASACHIPIFAPTRRPRHRQAWNVETSWGWAQVTGKLGQQHRDLLDAARLVAEREDWTTDGRMHLLVDSARLRSVMGGDGVNWPLIKTWFADLTRSKVEYHITRPEIDGFGELISDVAIAKVPEPPPTRPGAFSNGRRYLRISFGIGWSKLLSDDNDIRYPLRQVVGLRHGVSQAIARYCLSHRTVNDTISGLLAKVGAEGRTRDRRRELQADADALRALSIEISGDVVRRSSASKVPVRASKVPVRAPKVPVKTPSPQNDQSDQAGTSPALRACWCPATPKPITPPSPAFGRAKGNACGAATQNPRGAP